MLLLPLIAAALVATAAAVANEPVRVGGSWIFVVHVRETKAYSIAFDKAAIPAIVVNMARVPIDSAGVFIAPLRRGQANTIEVAGMDERALAPKLRFVNDDDTAPLFSLPPHGAPLPYVEVEAEDVATTGTIIGPDFTFTHLPSEASGRRAVSVRAVQAIYVLIFSVSVSVSFSFSFSFSLIAN